MGGRGWCDRDDDDGVVVLKVNVDEPECRGNCGRGKDRGVVLLLRLLE